MRLILRGFPRGRLNQHSHLMARVIAMVIEIEMMINRDGDREWGSCPDVAGAITRQNKARLCKWQLRCNQRLDRLVLIKASLGAARELG